MSDLSSDNVPALQAQLKDWVGQPSPDPRTGISVLNKLIQATGHIENYAVLLPLLLSLQGKPYGVEEHPFMTPVFSTTLPWRLLLKTGRQVTKTTTIAAQGVLQAAVTPYFKRLYVLPLYEQTRRFSSLYVKPFITQSPIRPFLVDTSCEQSVLQKTFINNAIMFFTFAFLDVDRARGVSADSLTIDEVQDMEWDFIPILVECMSHSSWGVQQYSGTPKTFDNTIQALWEDSSQAEWIIPCGCGHHNIPSMEFDLLGMIGPVKNVTKYGTGLICAKCGKTIHAEHGRYVHGFPERRAEFSAYHVPQPIVPLHYSDEKKWAELIQKRDKGNPAGFLNECLGESCDVGTKLITLDDLHSAGVLHDNELSVARDLPFIERYNLRVLGVDWGGGGQDEVSFTTITVLGVRPDFTLEVIYGERLHTTVNDVEEVNRIIHLYSLFSCQYLAHDFGGSGSVHETLLVQAGFPMDRIVPMLYVPSTTKNLVAFHPPENDGSRYWYNVNKARSLLLLCTLIKTKNLLLPKYESCKGLLDDFLNLMEDKREVPTRGDIFVVTKAAKKSDDFVHSTNFAAMAAFHHLQYFPNLAASFNVELTQEQKNMASPPMNEATY